MAKKKSKQPASLKSLDAIVEDFIAVVRASREVRWETALSAITNLSGDMTDLEAITELVQCDENIIAAEELMQTAIGQAAWAKMRRELLAGINTWYKGRCVAVKKAITIAAVAAAKASGDVVDAEYVEVDPTDVEDIPEDLAEEMAAAVISTDPVIEMTAEEAVKRALEAVDQ